jgi:glucosamine 6-phosphate synthetase-like amidotransferase/phosphosugar isomerase protein
MIDEIDELRRRVTELMKERIDEDVKRAAKALREAQVALWFLHIDAMGTVYEIAAAIIKSKLNDLLETFEVCFLDNSKGEKA